MLPNIAKVNEIVEVSRRHDEEDLFLNRAGRAWGENLSFNKERSRSWRTRPSVRHETGVIVSQITGRVINGQTGPKEQSWQGDPRIKLHQCVILVGVHGQLAAVPMNRSRIVPSNACHLCRDGAE